MEEELKKRIQELEVENRKLKDTKDEYYGYWTNAEERCKVLENALASIALTAGILKDSLVKKP